MPHPAVVLIRRVIPAKGPHAGHFQLVAGIHFLLFFLFLVIPCHADITTGLIGYWNFNDNSGTSAADKTTNANTGTLTNGPTWTLGKRGGAVSFDGTNDYVSVSSSLNSNYKSVFLWVNPSAWSAQWTCLINNQNLAAPYESFDIRKKSAGAGAPTLEMTIVVGGLNFQVDAGSLVTNTWQHVGFTYDGETLISYYNGAQVATDTSPSGTIDNSSSNINIGQNTNYAGRNFTGLIDDVRIYNRALSSGDVSELYANGNPGGSLVGWWKLDEGSGTITEDASGNGNHGTLTNGPAWITGKKNGGISFDGSNYVDTGPFTLPATVSFCAWIMPNVQPSAYKFYLGSDNGAGDSGIAIANDSSNYFYVSIKNGYYGQVVSFTAGAWYHICAVGNTSTGAPTMYVNGIVQSGGTSGVISGGANGGNLYIGATPRASSTWSDSKVDDVRIYNRALTAADVQGLYDASSKNITQNGQLGSGRFNN